MMCAPARALASLPLAAVLSLSGTALAQDAEAEDEVEAEAETDPEPDAATEGEPAAPGLKLPSVEHTAADVARAPAPREASGVAVAAPEPRSHAALAVPRAVLYVPRGLNLLVSAPFRGGAWLYERYQLRDRWKAIFFNDTGTAGLYPVAFFETGFGLNAGARFIHRDLFGGGERMRVRASFGGQFQQIYALKLDSGDRLQRGRTRLELEAEYEARPKDRFFGVGNNDLVASVDMPIDPYASSIAVESRFRQTLGRITTGAVLGLAGPLSTRLSSAILFKRSGDSEDVRPEDRLLASYDPSALPTFEDGTTYLYNEIELRIDTRRAPTRFEPTPMPSTGWLLSGFTGLATSIDRAKANYVRNGIDLQGFVRLGQGPRLLALRLIGEEVKGSLDQIPFVDLPRLGGPLLLRGYQRDRFRDRVFALGSAEYQFDLSSNMLAGFLFVDAGRVFPGLEDLSLDDLRIGYGGGIQIHSDETFLGRLTIATSIDGDLEVYLSFDPVYDPKARVERK
jgi:hypothetical protein